MGSCAGVFDGALVEYVCALCECECAFGVLFDEEDGDAVFGDLGDHAGSFMVSGKLIVNGNVGDRIGYGKHGGIIEINGKCGSLDSYWGDEGSIYQNGKLLYGK